MYTKNNGNSNFSISHALPIEFNICLLFLNQKVVMWHDNIKRSFFINFHMNKYLYAFGGAFLCFFYYIIL